MIYNIYGQDTRNMTLRLLEKFGAVGLSLPTTTGHRTGRAGG